MMFTAKKKNAYLQTRKSRPNSIQCNAMVTDQFIRYTGNELCFCQENSPGNTRSGNYNRLPHQRFVTEQN